MTLRLESTGDCLRTKLLLLVLEERPVGAAPYELVRRSTGYFTHNGSRIGPWLTVGERTFSEFNVAVRAICRSGGWCPEDEQEADEVEAWLEHQATWLRPAAVSVFHATQRGDSHPDATSILERSLGCIDQRLQQHPTLTKSFSPADACLWFLSALRDGGADLSKRPGISAALDHLEARPACTRALERFRLLNQQDVTEK